MGTVGNEMGRLENELGKRGMVGKFVGNEVGACRISGK